MKTWRQTLWAPVALALVWATGGCDRPPQAGGGEGADARSPVNERGSVQITARLEPIPEGAIFQRELYDYAAILKYEVLSVQRGSVTNRYLYVGHYNPWKPRAEAADHRVKNVGGTLRRFVAGEVHRLALEMPLEDQYMGGIVDKYFGQDTGVQYWAVWTEPARD